MTLHLFVDQLDLVRALNLSFHVVLIRNSLIYRDGRFFGRTNFKDDVEGLGTVKF